jgi:hypothetical protein
MTAIATTSAMDSLLLRLPTEVFNAHIMPYTYRPQGRDLLADIRSYVEFRAMVPSIRVIFDEINNDPSQTEYDWTISLLNEFIETELRLGSAQIAISTQIDRKVEAHVPIWTRHRRFYETKEQARHFLRRLHYHDQCQIPSWRLMYMMIGLLTPQERDRFYEYLYESVYVDTRYEL